ncbi:phytyl ester synthase 1, chloroplastic-like isoform X2 [Euphorbia lathyris]|uniref:phytyl ester synthase 1, chloroplastic-like isoform X2 n=1 Tax=Euphorbia lathyris TaxID=212925 RepID=UPI0033140949
MASVFPFVVSPLTNSEIKLQYRVRVEGFRGSDSVLSSNSIRASGTSSIGQKEKTGALVDGSPTKEEESDVLIDGGNEKLKSRVEGKWVKDEVSEDLEVWWDDGYGMKTVQDYFKGAKEITKSDGGPPRWFCPVECGQPLKNSPVLLYLPGFDGVGLGLILHHKALGKVFEVQCLHVPVYDRTPFEGLVTFVEEMVTFEHASSPDKPIYLVGDSFGGCLALAIAARNPDVDFVVILTNPGTSFDRSQLLPLIRVMEGLPEGLHSVIPYLLSSVIGNPLKLGMADIEFTLPLKSKIEQFSANLTGYLPHLSDTLLWKLKLAKSAAAYANSRLHAVKAEVLLLASGDDYFLPSRDEAVRLHRLLQNCIVRHFEDNGHLLLMEEGINLLTIIKGTGIYRRSRRHDFISDFVPPSKSEFKCFCGQVIGPLRTSSSYAMFSTLADGRIVRGLAGVPDNGPVLFVGYHMLLGLEVYSLLEEFLRQKNVVLRGIAHPAIFNRRLENSFSKFSMPDWLRVGGAVPATASTLFKLLSNKKHVLLYPGGAREALHFKGEEYKLMWPEQPEFVSIAVRFGATIVPFGSVGEDDLLDLVLDYDDLMKIPVLNDYIRDASRNTRSVRDESKGEVANEELFFPGLWPKIPGRIYSLFGKPIATKGKEELMKDKEYVNEMYLKVKSEVRRNIEYLLKKRDEDPYRNIFDRTLYRALYSPLSDIPAFDP